MRKSNLFRRWMSLASVMGLVALSGCTSRHDAEDALAAYNLTDVQIGGYAYFGCPEEDNYHTKFTAKNAKGFPVNDVVCSSLTSGAHVRFF